MFYFVSVLVLLLAAPVISVATEFLLTSGTADLWRLIGIWFTFWGVGVRLFSAGVMQVTRPQFTSASIFGIADPAAGDIVREVGYANLAMGTLGLASLPEPKWLLPAALVGGLYYGLAGVGHALRGNRNAKEQFALVTDFAMFALLAAFVLSSLL